VIHALICDMAVEQRIVRVVPALHLGLSLRDNHAAPDSCGAASPVMIVWTTSLKNC
jgi:hypothetical protein